MTKNSETEAEEKPPVAEPGPEPAAVSAPPLKPVVTFGAASVELHLVPGGRPILVNGRKTLAVKLSRDPDLELADENVRLVLAMAAGPDMRDAIESADLGQTAAAYAKATGNA